MKRPGSPDSIGALMTICPPTDEDSPRNKHVYGREFQSMLEGFDEEGCSVEESGHHGGKKRRLSVDQVKALEKNFEVENKLEPDRKVKLAQELGLQPRQVAVWFQNRRARWKTKQLERDYGVLKANYDSLKLNLDSLQRDNQTLLKEVKELKARLQEENSESDISVKEEMITLQENFTPPSETGIPGSDSKDLNCEVGAASLFPADFKDGSSDSDSSAILNEENNNNNNNTGSPNVTSSSSGVLQGYNFLMSSESSMPSSTTCFQFQKQYQTQYVRMEEHNFFSADEACNFFSDEQPPTLQQWYSSDEWN